MKSKKERNSFSAKEPRLETMRWIFLTAQGSGSEVPVRMCLHGVCLILCLALAALLGTAPSLLFFVFRTAGRPIGVFGRARAGVVVDGAGRAFQAEAAAHTVGWVTMFHVRDLLP